MPHGLTILHVGHSADQFPALSSGCSRCGCFASPPSKPPAAAKPPALLERRCAAPFEGSFLALAPPREPITSAACAASTNPGSATDTRYIKNKPAPDESTTSHDHAARCTSMLGMPSASTTVCTNMNTRPRISARHATAMPLSLRNAPGDFRFRVSPCKRSWWCAKKPPRLLWPLSVASCAAVLPSESVASMSASPPACAGTCAASLLPRIAAQCRGEHPSLSCRATSASQKSSSLTASGKPLYAAQCRGERPSKSSASRCASHRVLKWYSMPVCPY